MAARGMFFGEGPSACPFVALENDRDRRSDEPDHRHRCYAEPNPAPRAIAHQRAYCLTAAFPTCPIFQDWAVRAAATPVPLRPGLAAPAGEDAPDGQPQPAWASPPPWVAPGAGGAPDGGAPDGEQLGLTDQPALPPAGDAEEVERVPSLPAGADLPAVAEEAPVPPFLAGRAAAGSESGAGAEPESARHYSYQEELHRREDLIPPWEREPVQRAFPTLRARVGLGDGEGGGDLLSKITTLLAIGVVIALAVVVVILAPSLLGGGGGPGRTLPVGGATASPSLSPTASPRPTPTPAPTLRTYIVQSGDTLFAIARRFGLTVEQLLLANPQIQNADVVVIGQVINIPDDDFGLFSPEASPAP